MPRTHLIIALTALCTWPFAAAADLQATQRLETTWAEATDLDGEVVELTAGETPFVAIHRAQTRDTTTGSVVLLHGRGTNANSLRVVRPLRTGLSEHGWDTLSVQLPQVHAGAPGDVWLDNADTIGARLQAALDWLTERNQVNQVIVALGDSATVALRFVAGRDPTSVRALVLISIPGEFTADADRQALTDLGRPLLDVFAERDTVAVTGGAPPRLRAAREAGATGYTQRQIAGATLDFPGQEAQLLAVVRGWLHANAPGTEVRR